MVRLATPGHPVRAKVGVDMTGVGNTPTNPKDVCRNCRRPIAWIPMIGWLHSELRGYPREPTACETAHPDSCQHVLAQCPNRWTP